MLYDRLILVGTFILFFVFIGQAQPPDQLVTKSAMEAPSIGISDANLFDQFMVTVEGVGSNSRLAQEQQSLKPYMMPVRSLGVRGNDWSYALAGCLEYYINLKRNYKDNLSPDYIHLSLQSLGKGTTIEEGLRFLVANGTVSAAIIPYDAVQIPPAVYATQKYAISNFLHVFANFASEREKIFEVRKALMRGNPVIVQFQADSGFPQLGFTRTWEPRGQGSQQYTLLVVGYDENQQAFELKSAWGNDWANNGYLWVEYADFARAATNGYVMIPTNY